MRYGQWYRYHVAYRIRQRSLRSTVLAVAILTGIGGCTPEPLQPVSSPNAKSLPGSDGRTVLWIKPEAQPQDGAKASADDRIIESIQQNAGATAESVAALREQLELSSPRVRSAVIDALQGASHADAKIALLAACADRHPAVQALALDALSELSINTRDALFDTALGERTRSLRLGPRCIGDASSQVRIVAHNSADRECDD